MLQYGQDYWVPVSFELSGMRRATHRISDCTIDAQGQTSDAVDLAGFGLIGLILPTLDACNLTFTVSETVDGTYRTVYVDLGAAFTITAAAGNRAISADDMAPLCAYRWVKVVSSAAQNAPRILHFIVKG